MPGLDRRGSVENGRVEGWVRCSQTNSIIATARWENMAVSHGSLSQGLRPPECGWWGSWPVEPCLINSPWRDGVPGPFWAVRGESLKHIRTKLCSLWRSHLPRTSWAEGQEAFFSSWGLVGLLLCPLSGAISSRVLGKLLYSSDPGVLFLKEILLLNNLQYFLCWNSTAIWDQTGSPLRRLQNYSRDSMRSPTEFFQAHNISKIQSCERKTGFFFTISFNKEDFWEKLKYMKCFPFMILKWFHSFRNINMYQWFDLLNKLPCLEHCILMELVPIIISID